MLTRDIHILVVMKHHYGQMGFPEIEEIREGYLDILQEECNKYNSPPLCNDGYKAVIKETRIDA